MTDRAKTLTITLTVSEPVVADYFEQLIDYGNYGDTPDAVAAYLIRRGLDDLLRANVVGPGRRAARRRLAK